MKIRATLETETYLSASGYFAISQGYDTDDQQIVILSPDQMRILIEDMQKRLSDTSWWSDIEDEQKTQR